MSLRPIAANPSLAKSAARRRVWRLIAPLILLLAPIAGQAADAPAPLPRFQSLKSDKVNVRSGPGSQYPIDWIYQRRALPVEVTAEFETWRKIRDSEGTEGWVLQNLLSGKRTALVTGGNRPLRAQPATGAEIVAVVEPGVVASLMTCDANWCRVDISGTRGWLARAEIWGLYKGEELK